MSNEVFVDKCDCLVNRLTKGSEGDEESICDKAYISLVQNTKLFECTFDS